MVQFLLFFDLTSVHTTHLYRHSIQTRCASTIRRRIERTCRHQGRDTSTTFDQTTVRTTGNRKMKHMSSAAGHHDDLMRCVMTTTGDNTKQLESDRDKQRSDTEQVYTLTEKIESTPDTTLRSSVRGHRTGQGRKVEQSSGCQKEDWQSIRLPSGRNTNRLILGIE